MQAFKIVATTERPEAVTSVVNLNGVMLSDPYYSEILDAADAPSRLAKAAEMLQQLNTKWAPEITLAVAETVVEPIDQGEPV